MTEGAERVARWDGEPTKPRRSGGGAFLHSSARSVTVATTFLRTALLLARANETGVVEWVTWVSFQENPTTVRVSEEMGLSMVTGALARRRREHSPAFTRL